MRAVVPLILALGLLLGACDTGPGSGGKSMRHWAREARQYSIMPWFNSSGDERRRVAFERLREIGAPAVPVLLDLLENGPHVSKGDAFNALCNLRAEARSAVPILVAMLAAEDRELRERAVWILGCIGPDAEPAVRVLTALLRGPDERLRDLSARSLVQIGESGREALAAASRDADAGVRTSAAGVLSFREGDPAGNRAQVEAALDDPSAEVRARVLEALAFRDRAMAEDFVDLVVRGMNDPDAAVREAAAKLFVRTYQGQKTTPRFLVAIARNGDPGSRSTAVYQLGRLHYPGRIFEIPDDVKAEIIAVLREALGDEDPKTRVFAAASILTWAPERPEDSIAVLRKTIPLVEIGSAMRAAHVLWDLTRDPDDVLAVYRRGLAADSRFDQFEALMGIARMGRAGEPLRPEVEALLEAPDSTLRERARRALDALDAATA